MRLSQHIINIGRAVAYYPKLKRLTKSTTASILLCQLLYSSDKTADGWTDKDSYEIEDETGLTYNEQVNARKKLKELGILEEKYYRLSHKMSFYINQEELNRQWEELLSIPEKPENRPLPEEEANQENKTVPTAVSTQAHTTSAEKKGDIVDGYMNNTSIQKKIETLKEIKAEIEKQLDIIADSPRWETFIEFAYGKKIKKNENVSTFLLWAKMQPGFSLIYWTPEKMRTLWPQAFIVDTGEGFVKKTEIKEIDTSNDIPMPEEYRRRREQS